MRLQIDGYDPKDVDGSNAAHMLPSHTTWEEWLQQGGWQG